MGIVVNCQIDLLEDWTLTSCTLTSCTVLFGNCKCVSYTYSHCSLLADLTQEERLHSQQAEDRQRQEADAAQNDHYVIVG